MKCPTCKDSIEGKCCICGVAIPEDKQILMPDPFEEDIHDDNSLHLLCNICFKESEGEI